MLSDRVKNINVSPTLKIAAKAILMRSENIDIANLNVGEPDFPTPLNIKEAAKKAIDNNYTKYTMNTGIAELREAIAKKLKNDNQLDYDLDEIIVSNGAKQAIFNVVMSLVDKGDEVIIPAPYYPSYPEMVSLAQGKAVIIHSREKNGFKITARELKDKINKNTKAIILCNPCNPTGAVYTRSELEALAEVVLSKNIFVIADEVYEKLCYDDFQFVSFASISPEIKKKTIVINGVSKAYSMTGWRIGYAAGEKEIINGANKIQSHSTSNASSISQYASLEALSGPQSDLSQMLSEFEQRRNYVLSRLDSIKEVSYQKPSGAFYVFPNISSFFGKEINGTYIHNSYDLANYLLEEEKVVIVPGSVFGSDHHIRISYSYSKRDLEKGMDRFINGLMKL